MQGAAAEAPPDDGGAAAAPPPPPSAAGGGAATAATGAAQAAGGSPKAAASDSGEQPHKIQHSDSQWMADEVEPKVVLRMQVATKKQARLLTWSVIILNM